MSCHDDTQSLKDSVGIEKRLFNRGLRRHGYNVRVDRWKQENVDLFKAVVSKSIKKERKDAGSGACLLSVDVNTSPLPPVQSEPFPTPTS